MKALLKKKLPKRPTELLGDEKTDWMWGLLVSCWDRDPTARPKAAAVLQSVSFEGCSEMGRKLNSHHSS
jgi:hypothetical protein